MTNYNKIFAKLIRMQSAIKLVHHLALEYMSIAPVHLHLDVFFYKLWNYL